MCCLQMLIGLGVTYREDKPEVMQALKELHSEGAYPTPLWK